jgi:hypothetical protein
MKRLVVVAVVLSDLPRGDDQIKKFFNALFVLLRVPRTISRTLLRARIDQK